MRTYNYTTESYGQDIRVAIKVEISQRSESLYAFARDYDYQYSDLHKFLNGRKDWNLDKLVRLFCDLGISLEMNFNPLSRTPHQKSIWFQPYGC